MIANLQRDTATNADTDRDRAKPPVTEYQLVGELPPGGPVANLTLREFPYKVGRTSENALCISDSTVSSQHAVIERDERGLLVRDLGSTNGTFLNGRRVTTSELMRDGDLLQFGAAVFNVSTTTSASYGATIAHDMSDSALAMVQFGQILKNRDVTPHIQPIARIGSADIVAFEVLARSRYFGLQDAGSLFRAASKLNAEITLSQQSRDAGLLGTSQLSDKIIIFLNTHPREIDDPQLLPSLNELRKRWPKRRIAVEIHEATITDLLRLKELKKGLTDLGIALAFDDFGAGQSRLQELVEVRPDFLKFDIGMIADVERPDSPQRKITRTLVQMARDLKVIPLAEGVETSAQNDFCREVGFALGQGYFYGRPSPPNEWIINGKTKATPVTGG